MRAGRAYAKTPNNGVFWSLRALETGLLLAGLVGLGLFAWSLVDIVRIETGPAASTQMPPTAWPGIFVFFGSMVLLQVVRVFLERYRHDDGTQRGGARDQVAAATAELLETPVDESGPAADAAEAYTEG